MLLNRVLLIYPIDINDKFTAFRYIVNLFLNLVEKHLDIIYRIQINLHSRFTFHLSNKRFRYNLPS